MDLFRRAIRLFLTVLGLVAGFTIAVALFFWRHMVHPPASRSGPRQWTPA